VDHFLSALGVARLGKRSADALGNGSLERKIPYQPWVGIAGHTWICQRRCWCGAPGRR
jgi:hypothetical protein